MDASSAPSACHMIRFYETNSEHAPHLDPERLGLGRVGDRAAVIVRKHDHRHAGELDVEHALARAVEAIAIDQHQGAAAPNPIAQARLGAAHRPCPAQAACQRIVKCTTPQTSTSASSSVANTGNSGLSTESRAVLPSTTMRLIDISPSTAATTTLPWSGFKLRSTQARLIGPHAVVQVLS